MHAARDALLRKRPSTSAISPAHSSTREVPVLVKQATGSAYHSHADLFNSPCAVVDVPAPLASASHDGIWFIDEHGRKTILRGVNVSSNCKLPFVPLMPSHVAEGFYNDICVSFVNRPFPLDEADEHFARLQSWGFNFIRLLVTWEAIEHFGPRIYDEEYIDYIIQLLHVAKRYGIKCFIDPHQDVWSRHCGGSGAPNWTLRLAGLDVTQFMECGAAIIHNVWATTDLSWAPNSAQSDYPKMIWQTNYFKAAAGTMFTLFFGGALFAPEFNVQDPVDGRYYHIQHFLQFHYIQAIVYLARRIKDVKDLDSVVMGYDTLNEPNPGWIGCPNLTKLLPWQDLRQGPTPTPLQAFMLSTGSTVQVQRYKVTPIGPLWSGSCVINPRKKKAWLDIRPTAKQLFYQGLEATTSFSCSGDTGTRIYTNTTALISELFPVSYSLSSTFPIGGCIWAAHGIYNPLTGIADDLNYFSRHPHTGTPIDHDIFTECFWFPFIHKYSCELRRICPNTMIFIDPPVNERPPRLTSFPRASKDRQTTTDTTITTIFPHTRSITVSTDSSAAPCCPIPITDSQEELPTISADFDYALVYAPHFYDGLTLISKHFAPVNMEFLSFKRGLSSPIKSLRIGAQAVESGLEAQLKLIKREGKESIGSYPVLIGEIGIPFDMDNSHAYHTGDHSQQIKAMDANMKAIERSLLNATLWTYMPENTHDWGDGWNGEDLSIFTRGWIDNNRNFFKLPNSFKDTNLESLHVNMVSSNTDVQSLVPSEAMQTYLDSSQSTVKWVGLIDNLSIGGRALTAVVRPYPIHTAGTPIAFEFSFTPIPSFTFSFQPTLYPNQSISMNDNHNELVNWFNYATTLIQGKSTENALDAIKQFPKEQIIEIFFPRLHFPDATSFRMRTSTNITTKSASAECTLDIYWIHFPSQRLFWWNTSNRGSSVPSSSSTNDYLLTLECVGVKHTETSTKVERTSTQEQLGDAALLKQEESDWWFSWIHGNAFDFDDVNSNLSALASIWENVKSLCGLL